MSPGDQVLAGIGLLENGSWENALSQFDQAIESRYASDWKRDPGLAWGMAAAWINRSDALRPLGRFREAIRSLREAADAMRYVPIASHPAFPDRIILIHLKLAETHQQLGQISFAQIEYTEAEKLLAHWGDSDTQDRIFIGATFRMNRARFNLGRDLNKAAWEDAHIAVEQLSKLEKTPETFSASIQARGLLCRALAMLLDEPGGAGLEEDWIATATDAGETAINIALAADYQEEWITDLVRYCARIYRNCQPHSLGEFVHEHFGKNSFLRNDRTLVREITAELLLAKTELQARIRGRSHDDGYMEKQRKSLSSLQNAEQLLLNHL